MNRHRNPKKFTYAELVAEAENIYVDEEDAQSSDSDSDGSENNFIEYPFRNSDNSANDRDYEPDENILNSDSSDADEAIIDGNLAEDNLKTSILNERTRSDDEKQTQVKDADYLWFQNNNDTFVHRFSVPDERTIKTTLSRDMKEVDIFLKLFPKSLLMFIADLQI
ncbi:hypothetical protein HHI36_001119 [Cryptolaemus montrouzieri]|uniref:Uncharacterized protein n=1 Tax=Cryptolaemus montrouzieri TaxID=559131 RepID=A0ABD2P6W1_9CUCU